jgi:hypothetical protein
VEEGPLATQQQGTLSQPLWKMQHYVTETLNKTYLAHLFLTIPVAGKPITKFFDESFVQSCVLELSPNIVNSEFEVCWVGEVWMSSLTVSSDRLKTSLQDSQRFHPRRHVMPRLSLILLPKVNDMLKKHKTLNLRNGDLTY